MGCRHWHALQQHIRHDSPYCPGILGGGIRNPLSRPLRGSRNSLVEPGFLVVAAQTLSQRNPTDVVGFKGWFMIGRAISARLMLDFPVLEVGDSTVRLVTMMQA